MRRVASAVLAVLTAVVLATPVAAQGSATAAAETAPASTPVVIGARTTFRSTLLGAEYPILIYRPEGYEGSDARYPVLYLLDGDAHFHHVSGAVEFLAHNGRIPPMIVVGIGNVNRTRDLTPPTSDPAMREGSGGADRFLQFIADELVPHVESTHRTVGHRLLVGHSFGGLFALHALATRPALFQTYIVISPSTWWDDESLVSGMPAFLDRHPELRASLYMTTGNEGGEMLTSAQRLAGILDAKAPPRLDWRFRHMPDETHGTIPHRTLYDGLESIFADLRLDRDSTTRTVAQLETRYAALSEKFGYELPVTEQLINLFGYSLLGRGLHSDAIAAFRVNTERYPESANTYDSLGDGYAEAGDLANARRSYARAVELARKHGHPVLEVSAGKLASVSAALESAAGAP